MPQPNLIYVCEICQTILQEHHCKAICPNCGRMFDCSDLPLMAANATVDSASCELTIRKGSDLRDWMPAASPDAAPPVEETRDGEAQSGLP